VKAQKAITPIKGGFAPEYIAVLDYWTLQGYTLPTRSCQIKQNRLVQGLINCGAWAKGEWLRVWKYDGVDDNLIFTDWLNPGGPFTGTADATLSRTNNSGIFRADATGYFKHTYNPFTDAINITVNDGMVCFVPLANIDYNSGAKDDVNLTSIVRRGGANDDYNFTDYTFGTALAPAVGDIVFYGRKSATTLFSKINDGSEVDASVNSVAFPDNLYTTFGRNNGVPPAYSFDGSDAIGQGYAIEYMGAYTGVDLSAMYTAINNYLN
jgi:hypothetical protein